MTTTSDFHTFDDLPETQDATVAAAANKRIRQRHILATLREANGRTLSDLATARGVTRAAIHQLENRPLAKISVGSLVGYFQALGYDVDEDWVAESLPHALPANSD